MSSKSLETNLPGDFEGQPWEPNSSPAEGQREPAAALYAHPHLWQDQREAEDLCHHH